MRHLSERVRYFVWRSTSDHGEDPAEFVWAVVDSVSGRLACVYNILLLHFVLVLVVPVVESRLLERHGIAKSYFLRALASGRQSLDTQ